MSQCWRAHPITLLMQCSDVGHHAQHHCRSCLIQLQTLTCIRSVTQITQCRTGDGQEDPTLMLSVWLHGARVCFWDQCGGGAQ